jgi:hypothetical protein
MEIIVPPESGQPVLALPNPDSKKIEVMWESCRSFHLPEGGERQAGSAWAQHSGYRDPQALIFPRPLAWHGSSPGVWAQYCTGVATGRLPKA